MTITAHKVSIKINDQRSNTFEKGRRGLPSCQAAPQSCVPFIRIHGAGDEQDKCIASTRIVQEYHDAEMKSHPFYHTPELTYIIVRTSPSATGRYAISLFFFHGLKTCILGTWDSWTARNNDLPMIG
ncbi:hypothetical protein ACRALDRAFT_212695 [Sodiomyces alcalophilus JCM 7366]|uniref:uncharacterized protein n=1 Tax=Sodiomyces alcalophilus JCM 7366 TaxID=591952 RepID=UPI0039B40E58